MRDTMRDAAAYWGGLRSIVDMAIERALNGDDLYDAIYEMVDGSTWIAYEAERVVRDLTDHADAWTDHYESLADMAYMVDSVDGIFQIMAWCAMVRDCHGMIEDAIEDEIRDCAGRGYMPSSGQYQPDSIAEFLGMPEYDQIVECRRVLAEADPDSVEYYEADLAIGDLQLDVLDDPRVVVGEFDDPIVFESEDEAARLYSLLNLTDRL